MHRIDTTDREVDKHGVGKDGFTEGDPSVPTPATTVSAAIADAWQEELCNLVEGVTTLTKADNTQVLNAIKSLINRSAASSYQEQSNPKAFNLNAIGHEDGAAIDIAVGEADGTDAYIVYTFGGIGWTEASNPKNFALNDIVHGGLWVAVGDADGSDAYIITATSGSPSTWTERSNPKNVSLNGVAYSSSLGLYVAVGDADGSDAYLITSPDGSTWTERSNPKNFYLLSVAWSETLTLFCAVGQADGTDAYLVTSPDGINWTERSNPAHTYLKSVVWTGTNFVACGAAIGGQTYIITSPDGTNWTQRTAAHNVTAHSLATDGRGLVVVVGNSSRIQLSLDHGVTWLGVDTIYNSPALLGVVFNEYRFIIVGPDDSTDAAIFESASLLP